MNLFKKIKEAEEAKPVSKKSFTKSIAATAALLVVLTAATTAWVTTAWFSSNRDVDSNGMQMNVDTNPNLIIAKTADENIASLTASTTNFSVTFSDTAQNLTPAQHDAAGWGYTGLQYNTNPSVISRMTGYANTNKTAAFADVPVYVQNAERRYYVDYSVDIASADKALPAQHLYATLSSADAVLNSKDYQNAASVDFYLGSVAEANYKGTLNLAGKNYSNFSALTRVDLFSGANPAITSIPLNTSGHITVVMRFYFDGGLQKEANQAYVYSDSLSTANFTMSVHFEAADATDHA